MGLPGKSVILGMTLLLLWATAAPAAIIISQYYEGSPAGSNSSRWIELANTGTADVDLGSGQYQLSFFTNDNNRTGWRVVSPTQKLPSSSLSLNVTIPAGGTYLLGHTTNTAPGYAFDQSNLRAVSSLISFSGDDSVVLWTGQPGQYAFSKVVDVIGLTANTAADKVYVRNGDVTSGTNADFNAADWTVVLETDVNKPDMTGNARLGYHKTLAAVSTPEPGMAVGLGCIGALLVLRRIRPRRISDPR